MAVRVVRRPVLTFWEKLYIPQILSGLKITFRHFFRNLLAAGIGPLYIDRFPKQGDRVPLSTDGGEHPVWSPDGDRLFYRRRRNRQVIEIEFDATRGLARGTPRVLLDGPYAIDPMLVVNIDADVTTAGGHHEGKRQHPAIDADRVDSGDLCRA